MSKTIPPMTEFEAKETVQHENSSPEQIHHAVASKPSFENHLAAAAHPNASTKTLQYIHENAQKNFENIAPEEGQLPYHEQLQSIVAGHPNAPKEIAQKHFNQIHAPNYDEGTHKDIIFHPDIHPDARAQKVHEILSHHDDKADFEDEDAPKKAPKLTWEQKNLAKEYLAHPDTEAKHIEPYLDHPHPELAAYAANAANAEPEHVAKVMKRKDVEPQHVTKAIDRNEAANPHFLKAAYERFSKEKANSDDYGNDPSDVVDSVLEHPDTPSEVLDKVIAQKPKKNQSSWGESDREKALKHPNVPHETVKKLINKGDVDAMKAALDRPETDEDSLRVMHSHMDNLGYNANRNLLAHPNFPKDLTHQAIKESSDSARYVMDRPHLDKESLSLLLNHKNQNIAVDALKHKSITPDLVMQAYQRKAGAVSRAAAAHPLAPAELKVAKASSDPEAAKQLARTSDDPEVLHKIFEAHKDDVDVLDNLQNNKHLSPKTINSIIKREKKGDLKSKNYYNRPWESALNRHSNLDSEGIQHYLKTDPEKVANHDNLSTEQISGALREWANKTGKDAQEKREDFVNRVAKHKALSPEDAMDIVTGKHGKLEGSDFDFVHDHPAYTPEVVKAGLDTPPELTNYNLVGQLAQSKHLSPEDVKNLFNKHVQEGRHADDDAAAHHEAIAHGAIKNPNAPEALRRQALFNNPEDDDTKSMVHAALNSPALSEQELKDFYTQDHGNMSGSGTRGRTGVSDTVADLLKEPKFEHLQEDALKNSPHPNLISSIVSGGTGWGRHVDKENVIKALENQNPDSVKAAIKTFAEDYKPRQDRKGKLIKPEAPEEMQQHFDKLANHPDKEVATKAFQFMSPDKQAEVMKRAGEDSADIIPHLSGEALGKMSIGKDMDYETAKAILNHPEANHEHMMQAMKHQEPAIADIAIKTMVDAMRDKKNPRFTQEDLDQGLDAAMNNHPDMPGIAFEISHHARDPKVLKKMLLKPEQFGKHFDSLASNPGVKTSDLEAMTHFHDPEAEEAFSNLASHSKTPVSVLNHINEHYPQLMGEVAKNPKAASSKVLKTIIEKGDADAKANLVRNDKVPSAIKDELLKDKAVFLKSNPDHIDEDTLKDYAKDDDLSVVKAAVEHPSANGEVVSKAIDHVLKQDPKDPQVMDILKSAAKRNIIMSDKTKEKLLMHSPEVAAIAIRHSDHKIPTDMVMNTLTRYEGQPGFQDVATAVAGRGAFHDDKIASEILSKADLNHVSEEGHTMSQSLNHMLEYNKNIQPHHYDAALKLLENQRPPDFKYDTLGKNAEDVKKADGNLMTTVLGEAPDKSISHLVENPTFIPALVKNEKLKDSSVNKMLNKVTSEKPGSFGNAYFYEKLAEHPRMTADHLQKLADHVAPLAESKDPFFNNIYRHTMDKIASSNRISPQMAEGFLQTHPEQVAKNPRLPGEAIANHIKNNSKDLNDGQIGELSANPNFRLSMVKDHPFYQHNNGKNIVHLNVSKNPVADSKDLEQIWNDGSTTNNNEIKKNLIDNPRTTETLAKQMMKSGIIQERDMYRNPAIGGELWRAQKHEFPQGTGLEKGREVPDAYFRPREEKIKQVMNMIPENGHIEWADFKNANPSLAGDPLVQRLFTSAPKTRVDAAHAEKYLNEMPAKKFRMSYDKWTGMQRHNDQPQTVFQINNSEQIDNQYKQNPDLIGMYRLAQLAGQKTGHPNGPQAIGWSRVDTSDPNHWFVDEIQSDFNSDLSAELHNISETGFSKGLENDFHLDPKEAPKVAQKLADVFSGWERALLQNIIDTAKAHGVKKVSIHSGETKTIMNKGKSEGVTNKYDKLYNRLTQDMGFKPDKYDNLPTADENSKLKGKQIWTLDLDQLQQALNKPQKAS